MPIDDCTIFYVQTKLTVWMKTEDTKASLSAVQIQYSKQNWHKDSDGYRGSAFAEFSSSCSFLIRLYAQLEGAYIVYKALKLYPRTSNLYTFVGIS